MGLRRRSKDNLISASHIHAPKQERRLASDLGGSLTLGSGSGCIKGDVRITGVARIEAKSTQHKSYSLKRELVDRMEHAAIQSGEVPIFQIDFLTGENIDKQLVVMPMWAMEILLSNNKKA